MAPTPFEDEQSRREAQIMAAACPGLPCFDCAYRKGSPESDDLAKITASPEPFRCHQGMPVHAPEGHAEPGNYKPGDPTRYPVCEGWKRARRSAERRLDLAAERRR